MNAVTSVEPVSIEHLDGAWDIACEVLLDEAGTTCGDRADWWITCRHCHHTVAECDPHRRLTIHALEAQVGHPIRCVECGSSVRPTRWRDLFTITPIEGRP